MNGKTFAFLRFYRHQLLSRSKQCGWQVCGKTEFLWVSAMIDWNRVIELRNEIGADDFDEVVQLFLEETDEVVANINRNKSAQTIETALHFMKGSALNLGFCELAALCHTGEKAAAAGDYDGIDLAALIAAYDASKRAFEVGQNTEDAA
jgi:HPt (histidine-containing phosphotransfer) domain-containing protein